MASVYSYSVHQEFTSNLDSFPSRSDNIFNIELFYNHYFQFVYPEVMEIQDIMDSHAFVLPRERILSGLHGPRFIELILSSAESASELLATVVPDIFDFAWEMERHPINRDQRVLRMVINLSVVTPYDDREQIDRVLNELYMEAVVPNFRPAGKDSIEKYLEKVRFQDLEQSTKQLRCMVCLEEFDDHVGDIMRMPCGHVYHEKCIVKWLETSNMCPLCRYEMPNLTTCEI